VGLGGVQPSSGTSDSVRRGAFLSIVVAQSCPPEGNGPGGYHRPVELLDFEADHLEGVLALCRAEAWPSLPRDPDRALRVLTCPGGRTVVAVDQGAVRGFCQVLSDGELQAYCALLLVGAPWRRVGWGRALLLAALARAGGERLDLLAEPAAVDFYRSFRNREWAGFRLYPDSPAGAQAQPEWRPRADSNRRSPP